MIDHVRAWKGKMTRRFQRLTRTPPLVNFVILGAEKAGTTLLQDVLRRGPGVSMPESEVRYFRDPFFDDQERLFDAIRCFDHHDLIGIKHPSYLAVDHVPRRLREYNPNMRLVVSLRDPVDRAVSAYYHYLTRAQIPLCRPNEAFRRMLSQQGTSESSKLQDILSFGYYHSQLQRYYDAFPAEQIFVLEYEGLSHDRALWARLFDFLGVAGNLPEKLPQSNRGCYDWHQCVVRHFSHRLTTVFDDDKNVVGSKSDTEIDAKGATEAFESILNESAGRLSVPTISDEIIASLVDAYRPEVDRLIDSAWLTPQRWRHFPPQ